MVQIVAVTPANNLQKVFSLWLINLRGYHYSNTAADCQKWPLLCNHHYESVYILWSYWRRLQIVSDCSVLQCCRLSTHSVYAAALARTWANTQTQGQHSTLLRIKQERNMTRRQRQNIEELENCLDLTNFGWTFMIYKCIKIERWFTSFLKLFN